MKKFKAFMWDLLKITIASIIATVTVALGKTFLGFRVPRKSDKKQMATENKDKKVAGYGGV